MGLRLASQDARTNLNGRINRLCVKNSINLKYNTYSKEIYYSKRLEERISIGRDNIFRLAFTYVHEKYLFIIREL